MSRALDEALATLDRGIRTALTQGQHIPCLGRDEWTSDDDETQRVAAIRCRGCVVLGACSDVITATPRGGRWGVWAGAVHYPPHVARQKESG